MERSMRVSCKRYSRGGGKSAAGYNKYMKRVDEYCPKSGRWGLGKDEAEFSFDMNMPAFCISTDNPSFWEAADRYERANANLFVEMELAIPNELPAAGRKESLLMFSNKVHEIVGAPLPTSGSIHPGKIKGQNYHGHTMFCERVDDHKTERTAKQWFKRHNPEKPEKGGCKKIQLLTRKNIYAFRMAWEKICNKLLKKYRLTTKISCQSYKKRGINKIARPYIWKEPSDEKSLSMSFRKKAVAINEKIDLIEKLEKELALCENSLNIIKTKDDNKIKSNNEKTDLITHSCYEASSEFTTKLIEVDLSLGARTNIIKEKTEIFLDDSPTSFHNNSEALTDFNNKSNSGPNQVGLLSENSEKGDMNQKINDSYIECYKAYENFVDAYIFKQKNNINEMLELDASFILRYLDKKEFSIEELTKAIITKSKGVTLHGDLAEYIAMFEEKFKKAYELKKRKSLSSGGYPKSDRKVRENKRVNRGFGDLNL